MSRATAAEADGTTAAIGVAETKVQAKHGGDAAARLGDTRSLVAEMITSSDLSRLSFLRKEITKRSIGFDRIQFITTMAT